MTKLVLDPPPPQIHELAVRQVCEEQIMHQLPAVPFCQGFHRLQLENRPASHQQVKVVGLAEIAEPHVDRHLTPCVRNPEGDFTVVDLRVEQPAQLRCTSKACRMTSYAQTLNASSSIRRISAATQIGMIIILGEENERKEYGRKENKCKE